LHDLDEGLGIPNSTLFGCPKLFFNKLLGGTSAGWSAAAGNLDDVLARLRFLQYPQKRLFSVFPLHHASGSPFS
jgi:hypothetical protein